MDLIDHDPHSLTHVHHVSGHHVFDGGQEDGLGWIRKNQT